MYYSAIWLHWKVNKGYCTILDQFAKEISLEEEVDSTCYLDIETLVDKSMELVYEMIKKKKKS